MTLNIIAGANGSGKTTFALSFAQFNQMSFVNADEIAKKLNPQDMEKEKVRAGRMFLAEIKSLIGAQKDMILETTMSGKYLGKIIDEAKKVGYKIVIFYLFLGNVTNNIARVQNRVFNGGHNVPNADIVRRYHRSLDLFWYHYKNMVDGWYLFYNADDEFEEIANFSDAEVNIFHDLYYQRFLESINENAREL